MSGVQNCKVCFTFSNMRKFVFIYIFLFANFPLQTYNVLTNY